MLGVVVATLVLGGQLAPKPVQWPLDPGGATAPAATAGPANPAVSECRLPLVLADYADEVQEAAGIGRGCVVLEAADVRCALKSRGIDAEFLRYRARIREALEPVKGEVVLLDSRDRHGRSHALDQIHRRHVSRVRGAVDAAQAELLTELHADEAARQRMIRHALWRAARGGSDGVGFDVGMLLEDGDERTSTMLLEAIGSQPDASAQLRELVAAHDARVGPIREASIAMHRAAFSADTRASRMGPGSLERSLAGVRESNDVLLDGVARIARDCGAFAEACEWRARAFRLRGGRLLPQRDLVDCFDSALRDGDALDVEGMRMARLAALAQRDDAMRELLQASMDCQHVLSIEGPDSQRAPRVIRQFATASDKWERCERRIADTLRRQLCDTSCPAGRAIDAYLQRQGVLGSEHWRDLLQFWTAFVEDQRSPN